MRTSLSLVLAECRNFSALPSALACPRAGSVADPRLTLSRQGACQAHEGSLPIVVQWLRPGLVRQAPALEGSILVNFRGHQVVGDLGPQGKGDGALPTP